MKLDAIATLSTILFCGCAFDEETAETGEILIDEHYANGNQLQVYDLGDKRFGVSVNGPIGTPLHEGDGTLVEIVHQLDPTAEISPVVEQVSRRIAAVRNQADVLDDRILEPIDPPPAASASSFTTQACKTFTLASGACTYVYTPSACIHHTSSIEVRSDQNGASGIGGYNDRSYSWNPSRENSHKMIRGTDGSTGQNVTFLATQTPNTWGWITIYGSGPARLVGMNVSSKVVIAFDFEPIPLPSIEHGVTWHRQTFTCSIR